MIGEVKKLLIIPHLKIHNANALSSPFTIGFPAMTAWLGVVHALQRKLHEKGVPASLSSMGVVCHDMDLQVYKGENDYVHSIIGTGNPLDKSGSRPAFIEEARCHLDVSLVIEFDNITIERRDELIAAVEHLLHAEMKCAGGDIQSFQQPICISCEDGDESDLRKVQRELMPGYALVERRDLMVNGMENGLDALDALIDYLSVHSSCDLDEDDNVVWRSYRKSLDNKPAGWIVPIATGFHAISEVGTAKNQRDAEAPHRFAESIVTLGEFKMPHRINSVEDLLWRYHVEGDKYLCQQKSQSRGKSKQDSMFDSIESEF